MTFDIDVVLRERNYAVTEQVEHGTAAAEWTDADVKHVLERMLLAIDRTKNPGTVAPPVILRGFSWIVEPMDDQVVIAIEIPMGVAVAGPFGIEQPRLDAMVRRVVAAAGAPPTVH